MDTEGLEPAVETPETDLTPTIEEAAPETEIVEDATEEENDELAKLLREATGTEETDSPEVVDVEYEGKTYKLPPELKDAVLRQSDYTKKTQEVAEQRRAIEAEAKQLAEANAITKEEIGAAVQYQMIQEKMQALINTDISDLSPEDITSLRLDYSDLEKQASHWANVLEGIAVKRQESASQQIQQARDAALKEAARIIPNFTEERRQALEQFAVSQGATEKEVASLTDPNVYKILHLADIGQRFIASQSKAKSVAKAQEAAPVPEVGGKKATARKDPEKMSAEEYHAMRLKQRMG